MYRKLSELTQLAMLFQGLGFFFGWEEFMVKCKKCIWLFFGYDKSSQSWRQLTIYVKMCFFESWKVFLPHRTQTNNNSAQFYFGTGRRVLLLNYRILCITGSELD